MNPSKKHRRRLVWHSNELKEDSSESPTKGILTTGYEKLTPADFEQLVEDLNSLPDVHSGSSGRDKREFRRRELTSLLGERYEWHGKELGGKGKGVTAAGLEWLKAQDGRRLMLICTEHSPGDCHRYRTIAVPLLADGIDVLHVFEDEAIETADLKKAIDEDTDYECYSLSDLIEEVKG